MDIQSDQTQNRPKSVLKTDQSRLLRKQTTVCFWINRKRLKVSCPFPTDIIWYMSLPDAHTTIYCVYFLLIPQDIVSTFALNTWYCVYLPCTADRPRTAGQEQRWQLQAGAEGAQRRHSFRPWPCRGRAEESPWTARGPSQEHRGGGQNDIEGILSTNTLYLYLGSSFRFQLIIRCKCHDVTGAAVQIITDRVNGIGWNALPVPDAL